VRFGPSRDCVRLGQSVCHHFSGDDFGDLVPSDRGSITSDDDERSDQTDDDESVSQNASVSSSVTSANTPALNATAISAVEEEFQSEVRLSLDRAFSEGHSLEDASLELKTLRMASNVPLRRVREAVVAGVVEEIPLVEGAVPQRAETKKWVDRWGGLINLIGGVDGVETVSILQVSSLLPGTSSSSTSAHNLNCNSVPLRDFNALSPVWPDTCGTLSKRHCRGRRHPKLVRSARIQGRKRQEFHFTGELAKVADRWRSHDSPIERTRERRRRRRWGCAVSGRRR
jgi:hypothetical protein